MDWYLDGRDVVAAVALRKEIGAYLDRHAAPGEDIESAEIAVSELLANLPNHAPGPAWVSLTWATEHPVLEVRDVGPGFEIEVDELPPVDEIGGRGLFIASAFVESLDTTARRNGGAVTRAVLQVSREPSASHDPLPSTGTPLPSLDEALPEGGFAREAFLRALVVQLAQAVERNGGPDLAEAAVAQVGVDIGQQMEAEYRLAEQVVDRLDSRRLADCFVRLKHAIDGDFFIVEVSEKRIVLGANSCPFGDVVRQAPALCRMTSGVFGGIAANTNGEAWVTLEERIAVGDPQCRVVIDLAGPDDDKVAHHYQGRRPPPDA